MHNQVYLKYAYHLKRKQHADPQTVWVMGISWRQYSCGWAAGQMWLLGLETGTGLDVTNEWTVVVVTICVNKVLGHLYRSQQYLNTLLLCNKSFVEAFKNLSTHRKLTEEFIFSEHTVQ